MDPQPTISLFPQHILLVEDDEVFPRLIAAWLHFDWPLETTLRVAPTLQEGLTLLHSHPIDIAIVDLAMPAAPAPDLRTTRGLDVPLALLQSLPAGAPPLPMVVLTGSADSTLAYQALAMGVEEFVLKGTPDLRHALRTALLRAWARQRYLQGLMATLREGPR